MPPPNPPKTSLSKGTLGLKFMNRTIPASPAPSSASAASTPARNSPAPASAAVKNEATAAAAPSGGRMTFGVPPKKEEQPASAVGKEDDEDWGSRKVAGKGSRPTVIQEASLLSFPLLSSINSFSSTSSSYSSMPLTSSAISGRRSFGGANIEIEKLNDPSSHPEPEKDGPGETNHQRKKRLQKERDAAPVAVRRSAGGSSLSSAKTGKRTAALERERDEERERESGSAKKRRLAAAGGAGGRGEVDPIRWEADDDEVSFSSKPRKASKPLPPTGGSSSSFTSTLPAAFARPAGFDGAKKGASVAAKGKKGKGVMGDYQWAKKGEVREWDEGKEPDSEDEDALSDSDEDDDEDMTALFDAAEEELGVDEDDDEESADEVEARLGKGKAVGGAKKGSKADSRGKEVSTGKKGRKARK
ncbi:hypothetical protein JCM8097_008994 [Rhodosporidiobolus ruineniae]